MVTNPIAHLNGLAAILLDRECMTPKVTLRKALEESTTRLVLTMIAVAGALVTAYKEPGVANFRNAIIYPETGQRPSLSWPMGRLPHHAAWRCCARSAEPRPLSALWPHAGLLGATKCLDATFCFRPN